MSISFNNIKRYMFMVLLAAVMIVCTALPASAEGLSALAFKATVGPEDEIVYTFNWWQPHVPEENKYSFALPYELRNEKVTVVMKDGKTAVFDGAEIRNGTSINAPAEGVHSLFMNNTQYTVTVFYGADIPSVYITTESGSMDEVYADKSHKEAGVITIMDRDEVQYNGELDYIKGRGNATWGYDKKPFNIKLGEKADLFGMGKQKGWSMLANYVDVTGVRNKTAIDFADAVGIEFSSKSEIVDLYVNGDYMGNYTLIEKVEIDDNRVEITNLEDLNEEANPDIDVEECELGGIREEDVPYTKGSRKYVKIPNNPEDITGGYLLEYELLERYDQEVSGFVTEYGQTIIVKSPEYASEEQVNYIADYYQEFEDAVRADNGINEQGKHYSDYMDMESMAKMYVFQEYVKNLDAGLTSFYLYKEAGGKLVAAPVWDFDMAVGHKYKVGSVELADSRGYLATGRKVSDDIYTIISLLCQHAEFRQLAAQQWKECFRDKILPLVAAVDSTVKENHASLVMNKNKWTDGFVRSVADVTQWYNNEVEEMKNFLEMRAGFMEEEFSQDKVYVSYWSNGAEGEMLDVNAYDAGDSAEVKDNAFTNGKREFLGWNTAQDGSGTAYMPDDEFEITENTTLYAQWEKPSFFEMIAEFFAGLF